MQHPALAHLPTAFFAVAPELAAFDVPDEHRATCDSCAVGAPVQALTPDRPFNQHLRCCTYHPNHTNWMVGRGLRRGGISEERIRLRLQDPEGVTSVGVAPTQQWSDRYSSSSNRGFGRDAALSCPYLLPEQQGCAVWRDRGAVCRTWHCRYADGPRGLSVWDSVRGVMMSVERRLAAWCIIQGDAPEESEWDDVETMVQWFISCADAVDKLNPKQAVKMRDKILLSRLADLQEAVDAHGPALPDYLGPHIGEVRHLESGLVRLYGHSALDGESFDPRIFQLLSRLDGHTRWQDALVTANAAVPGTPFTPQLIESLFRRGMLMERDPNAPDPPPGVSNPPNANTHLPALFTELE
ncbi:MAG: hypothetical protein AB8H79_01735 [Myxococcota bacterium]